MDLTSLEKEIGFARDRIVCLEQRVAAQTTDSPALLAETVSELSTIVERLRRLQHPEPWDDDSDFSGFDPGTDPGLPEGELDDLERDKGRR